MTLNVAAKAFAIWLAILALAVINGTLREAVFIPHLGARPGMLLSGGFLCGLILAVSYLFLPWLGRTSPRQLMLIGTAWLLMTLAFEFAFGLLRGSEMAEILDAYRFRDGNIWPVVLLVIAVSPWLAAKVRGWE